MRRPWIAVVLSLLAPGLGHLYAGRLLLGVVFFLLGPLLGVGMLWLLTWEPSNGALLGFFGLVLFAPVFYVYVVLDALRVARSAPKDYEPKAWQHPLLYAVALVLGFLVPLVVPFFLRADVLAAFKIPAGSMAPTIRPGDRIFVVKWGWDPEDVERGDIVVFLAPDRPRVHFIKRIEGLPGDEVEGGEGERIVVPEGHVYVLGDNHEDSRDSRQFGPVPLTSLVGPVYYRYWPPSRFGVVE